MWKSSFAALVLPMVASGCFYMDSVNNQRPSVQIRQEDPLAAIVRGQKYTFTADAHDPDGVVISYQWRAYACGDATMFEDCQQTPFDTDVLRTFEIQVPPTYTSASGTRSTASLRIVLEGKDELGATARPQAELILPVTSARPTIRIDRVGYAVTGATDVFVVGTPVTLYALVEDLDDAPGDVDVTWELFSGAGGSATLADGESVPDDPDHPNQRQYVKILTPDDIDTYTVKVTAIDALDAVEETMVDIVVGEDGAPCIAQVIPLASPTGALIPVTAPTLFRVPVIADDLDPYPVIPNDPIAGAPTFTWSIKAPGQASYAVQSGVIGNNLAFDPATYAIGDLVDIRVEIADRKATPVSCPAGDAFCSTISSPTCNQRVTWRVEVR